MVLLPASRKASRKGRQGLAKGRLACLSGAMRTNRLFPKSLPLREGSVSVDSRASTNGRANCSIGRTSDLLIRKHLQKHLQTQMSGSCKEFFSNILKRPLIFLKPCTMFLSRIEEIVKRNEYKPSSELGITFDRSRGKRRSGSFRVAFRHVPADAYEPRDEDAAECR